MSEHPTFTPITFTPNLQTLVGSLPKTPEIEPEQDTGFNFGSIFKNALPAVAKTVTNSAMAAMEALDVGRQYVAKPLLGLGVFVNDPSAFINAHGTPLSINNLRDGWDEAPLHPWLKFGMEMAFDPVNYIGMGLFKTPVIRGAEALLPIALARGVKPVAMTFTARMKLASKIDEVPGYSQLVNRALKGKEITPAAITNFRRGARKLGLDQSWVDAQAHLLKLGDPTMLKGMRGGLLTGALPKNKITQFMGQADFLAEGIWASGLSIPAWGLSKIPYQTGMFTTAINAAGKSVPIKQLTGLMGFVGPRSWKMMDEHAAAGNLGSWGLGLTHASAQRSVRRTAKSIMSALKDAESKGTSITEIGADVFYKEGKLLDDGFFGATRRAGQDTGQALDDMETFRPAIGGLRNEANSNK